MSESKDFTTLQQRLGISENACCLKTYETFTVFARIKTVPRAGFEKEIPMCAGKVNLQFALEQPMKAQRRSRGVPLLFNVGARCGEMIKAKPPSTFPSGKKTRYPLYRRLGGPQGRSGIPECGQPEIAGVVHRGYRCWHCC